GVEGEPERRPHGRALDLDERRLAHQPGRGKSWTTAGGLDETHPPVAHLRFRAKLGKGERLDENAHATQPDAGGRHAALAVLTEIDDPTVLDLHPAADVVREPCAVRP